MLPPLRVFKRCQEGEAELLGNLVLPLHDEVAGSDDHAAFEIATDQQFLDSMRSGKA